MTSLPSENREMIPSRVLKRKMVRRCKMMWWIMLLVFAAEAQEIRIPAYTGRTQNKPVIRVVPSDGILIRVRNPDQSNAAPTLTRQSSVMRIQPILISPGITPRVSLLGTLTQMGLRRIAAIIDFTQLQKELQESGPVTLFAPTDEAFSLISVPSNPDRLREFVLQHIVSGRILPINVKNDVILPSLRTSGTPLRLNVYDDGQMLSVSGSQFLDDARDSGNVRIQPIDRVLYPISNEDLSTEIKLTFPKLNDFLMRTALGPKLSSGTFTFFAPTDEAFEALTPEVEEKLSNNITLLTKVLLNHVVPGTHYSAVLAHGYSLRTLGGEPVHFTNRRGLILANGVPLVKSDVSCNNGVIHAINRLLLPPELHSRRRPATIAPPPFTMNTLPDLPSMADEFLPVPVYREPPPPIPRSITKTISTPLQLPDGKRMTFTTANSLLRRSLLLSTLRNNGSEIGYTILVPTDNAYKALGQNVLDRLRRNSRLLRRMLLSQMMEGQLNLTMGKDKDQPVKSLGGTVIISSLNGGSSLMVGGARVLSVRQAADGMILVTDKVILPSTSRNVADALQPFPQFKQIIKSRPNIQNLINNDGSVYTIFAPTDAALSTLPPYQLQDTNFLSELFWSHVVPGAYYRSRLSPGLRLTTVRGNVIIIHRTPSGGVFVNEKPVTGEEIITGNGVVHPIDSLLFIPATPQQTSPDQDFDDKLNQIGNEFNATTFLDWMKKAHLRNQLRSPSLRANGCTLFLPTNSALSRMSPTLRAVTIGDPERLNKFIRFHISPQILSWDSVQNNGFMPSLLPGKRIRCNIYAKDRMPGNYLTVSGCIVRAIRPITPDSNVSVAVIDEAMTPPPGDLALTIAKTPMLSNFSKVLTLAGGKDVFKGEEPFTLFAPNNCAFSNMETEIYQQLIANRKKAIEFVRQYLVKSCLYSTGFYDQQQLLTEAGTYLIVQITPDCILISGNKLLYGDVGTTNGVLHVIASISPS